MYADGEFDYRKMTKAELEYAILHIDGSNCPKNLANARNALEERISGASPEPVSRSTQGMPVQAQTLPITLNPDPTRSVGLLIVSSLFVAAGIFLGPEDKLSRLFCVGFFGLCFLVALVRLLPRSSYLVLTRDGLTIVSLYRKSFVAWKSVRTFVAYQVQSNEMVGWTYLPGREESTIAGRLGRLIGAGVEGALPDTYGMSADDLATLLNHYRETHAVSAL
jgi:hypothetical protein